MIIVALAGFFFAFRHMHRVAANEDSSSIVAHSSSQVTPTQAIKPVIAPGEHRIDMPDGRKYILFVPRTYDPSLPAPLVLFFHGGMGDMEQAAAEYGWEEKAEQAGFILAFPNGSSPLPRQHLATWNAGNCCGYAMDKAIDDVAFARSVVKDIQERANIDAGKVYAAGMSNGGMMVHRLACEMADTFRAVASVAGTDNTIACSPSKPISVMHIHAKDDTHVLFNGGAGKDAFRDNTKVTDFTSVAETADRWIRRDRLNPSPKRVLEVPGAYADLYISSQNESRFELVVTETGGHSWPGKKTVNGKSSSQAVVANDFIWDFFVSAK